jgi:phosphatidylglycerophosphate synthase
MERAALHWLAGRMPSRINADHLTALGGLAMVAAGVLYYFAGSYPVCLHLVNLALLINWFGDSLDGTLARYRNQQRPRYGFYVDHIVDAIGVSAILGGLSVSGLIHPFLAAVLLVSYLALSIEVYLTTYTLGVFTLSHGKFSPTEGRILLSLINLMVWFQPEFAWGGYSIRVFDALGAGVEILILTLFVTSVVRHTATLYRMETRR